MFNIDSTVSALIAAEKVNNSRNLTDLEKSTLLEAISASLMIEAPGCPDHAHIIAASIERMTRNERANIASAAASLREAEVQDGPTEGIEDAPSVAAEGTEEDTEAPEGQATGSEELPEVTGRAASSGKRTKAGRAPFASKT